MKFTVRQIANLIGGEVVGDDLLEINQFYKIEEGKQGGISFLANLKYEPYLYQTSSTAVIVADSFEPKQAVKASLIKVKDPYASFTILLREYDKLKKKTKVGIEQPVVIKDTAEIGNDVYLGAFSYVAEGAKIGHNTVVHSQVFIGENVQIGANCVIYPGVKIFADTEIGNHCIFHSGAVVGCDGFGFAPEEDGTFTAIPQLGNVLIEDNVSIGANATLDRATMGSTIIRKGVKIDNLVQIAHNVEIGENTVLAAQTGIAGSTKIGANCIVGGQVGLAGHLNIADGTKIGAQAGVRNDVKKKNISITGTPHNEITKYLKSQVLVRKLPELFDRIKEIEEKIDKK